jgi:hypothetical protein
VRSVGLVVLLSLITVGIYPAVWYIRRQPFLDALDSDQKMGKTLAWAPLVTFAIVVALGILIPDDAMGGSASRALSGGAGAVTLMTAFRVAHILRSHFARTGRLMNVSGVATFFLGTWYLQHVINVAAATPGRLERKKRKKKKERERTAGATAGANDGADRPSADRADPDSAVDDEEGEG